MDVPFGTDLVRLHVWNAGYHHYGESDAFLHIICQMLRRLCTEPLPDITKSTLQWVFSQLIFTVWFDSYKCRKTPTFIICFIFSICKKNNILAAKLTSVSWRSGTVSFARVCAPALSWAYCQLFKVFLPSCITSSPSSQPLSHWADWLLYLNDFPRRSFKTFLTGKDGAFLCVFCKLEREGV